MGRKYVIIVMCVVTELVLKVLCFTCENKRHKQMNLI